MKQFARINSYMLFDSSSITAQRMNLKAPNHLHYATDQTKYEILALFYNSILKHSHLVEGMILSSQLRNFVTLA